MNRSLFSSSFNITLFICYVESNYIFIHGILGIRKIKYGSHLILSACDGLIYFIINSFISYFLKRLILSTLSNLFWSVCFGFSPKYRMKGLGHRIFIKRNAFLYKIGYSHFVYKVLGLNLINYPKRFKKEYYFAIRSIDKVAMRNQLFIIQSYRIPNCYCLNGIFIQGLVIIRKDGKKSFMLQSVTTSVMQ